MAFTYPWDLVCVALLAFFTGVLMCCIKWRYSICRILGIKLPERWQPQPQREYVKKLPKNLRKAYEDLEEVTDSVRSRTELGAQDSNECSICLASLFGSPVASTMSLNTPRPADPDLEAGPASRCPAARTVTFAIPAIPARSASISSQSSASSSSTTRSSTEAEKQPCRIQPIEEQIIQLRKCQHCFHGRCLASWHLQAKYDCPVCRTPYMDDDEREETEQAQEELGQEAHDDDGDIGVRPSQERQNRAITGSQSRGSNGQVISEAVPDSAQSQIPLW